MSVNLSGRITLLTSQNEIPGAPVYNDLARLIKYISTDDNINISINAAGGLDFSTTGKVGGTQNPDEPITPPSGGGGFDPTNISNYSYFDANGNWVCNAGDIILGSQRVYVAQTTLAKADFAQQKSMVAEIAYANGGYSITRSVLDAPKNGLFDGKYYVTFSALYQYNGDWKTQLYIFGNYNLGGIWL